MTGEGHRCAPSNIAFFRAGKKLGRNFIIFMGRGRNMREERERERERVLPHSLTPSSLPGTGDRLRGAAPDAALLG